MNDGRFKPSKDNAGKLFLGLVGAMVLISVLVWYFGN